MYIHSFYLLVGLHRDVASMEIDSQQPGSKMPLVSGTQVSSQTGDGGSSKEKGKACRRLMAKDSGISAPGTSGPRPNRLRRNRKSKDPSEDPPMELPVSAEVRGREVTDIQVAPSPHPETSQSLTPTQQTDKGNRNCTHQC